MVTPPRPQALLSLLVITLSCSGSETETSMDAGTVQQTGCNDDSECMNPSAPRCIGNACVECGDNSHCPSDRPVCRADRLCGECAVDTDCPEGRSCTNLGFCEECALGCAPPTSVCIFKNGTPTCGECGNDDDCIDLARDYCDVPAAKCVQCVTSEQCGASRDCIENICVVVETTCTTDDACPPERPKCDQSTQRCEECLVDTDCGTDVTCGEFLGHNICLLCTSGADCPMEYPDCREDGVCCGGTGLGTECIRCVDSADCPPNQVCERRNDVLTCWPN